MRTPPSKASWWSRGGFARSASGGESCDRQLVAARPGTRSGAGWGAGVAELVCGSVSLPRIRRARQPGAATARARGRARPAQVERVHQPLASVIDTSSSPKQTAVITGDDDRDDPQLTPAAQTSLGRAKQVTKPSGTSQDLVCSPASQAIRTKGLASRGRRRARRTVAPAGPPGSKGTAADHVERTTQDSSSPCGMALATGDVFGPLLERFGESSACGG